MKCRQFECKREAEHDGLCSKHFIKKYRHNIERKEKKEKLPVDVPNPRSGYRGVTWYRKTGCWRASIVVKGNPIYLGSFATAKKAAKEYDIAAREYHGKKAVCNFKTWEWTSKQKENLKNLWLDKEGRRSEKENLDDYLENI